ncbi:MAG: LCP family protein [Peptococcaceae bacterium]|nr:LCP family protein [Peptococcaceae bacterium]
MPFVVLFIVLVAVLMAVVVIAAGGGKSSGQTQAETGAVQGQTSAQIEKWQEGVIRHNGKYYKFNPDMDIYLFMGIDKDEEVSMTENYADGGQSDAMFLLLTNSREKTVSVISINRNTMTDIVMYDENGAQLDTVTAQICTQHAFGDGGHNSCRKAADAVSGLFYNLPINGYMSINMGAIPIMNDGVGGVEVAVLTDITDTQRRVELKKGETVTLRGMEAYCYLRSRDINSFDSASDRLRRQEQYITAYMEKLESVASGSTSKVLEIYEAMEPYIVTNITYAELLTELMEYEFNPDGIYTVPGETRMGEEFEEFYADDEALYELILEVCYEEVS